MEHRTGFMLPMLLLLLCACGDDTVKPGGGGYQDVRFLAGTATLGQFPTYSGAVKNFGSRSACNVRLEFHWAGQDRYLGRPDPLDPGDPWEFTVRFDGPIFSGIPERFVTAVVCP